MKYESQVRASKKYNQINCKMVNIQLNKKYDQDILTKLEEQKNRQGYIKRLIRQDILANKEEK